MKNFFYFSSLMYTISLVLLVFASVVWPTPAQPQVISSPVQPALYLIMFIVSVMGFTGFCIGMWGKMSEGKSDTQVKAE